MNEIWTTFLNIFSFKTLFTFHTFFSYFAWHWKQQPPLRQIFFTFLGGKWTWFERWFERQKYLIQIHWTSNTFERDSVNVIHKILNINKPGKHIYAFLPCEQCLLFYVSTQCSTPPNSSFPSSKVRFNIVFNSMHYAPYVWYFIALLNFLDIP